MSSLAASRADNFYYPPEWRPEYGGISKYQGSKGANQYQQSGVIRFELPFDGWCVKCKRHLAKGTRFNAKKENIGKYFTTILYQFNMKCPSCDQILIIKTNPKERTYDYSEGIKQMEQDYIPDADDHVIPLGGKKEEIDEVTNMTEQEKAEYMNNPIYHLQNEYIQIKKVQSVNERLESLLDHNISTKKDDYIHNSRLRTVLRTKKQIEKEQLLDGMKLQVSYPVLPYTENDSIFPPSVPTMKKNYMSITSKHANINEHVKFTQIKSESIFSSSSSSSSRSSCSSKSNSSGVSNNLGRNKRSRSENNTMAVKVKTSTGTKQQKQDSNSNLNPNMIKRQRIHDSKMKQARLQIDTSVFMRK